MTAKRLFLLAGLFALTGSASAQIKLGKKGQLSGSLESNSVYYVDDNGFSGGKAPEDHFGSNNYLKLSYTIGRFSAGAQMDGYFPALQGYDFGRDYHRASLSSKYVQWVDKNYSVRLGDVFDQYGNGLIFRSYEDRQLGFNNSIEGGRVTARLANAIEVKAMFGRPRLYTGYARSWVGGADLSVELSKWMQSPEFYLAVEGSYVNRMESFKKGEIFDPKTLGMKDNLGMWSARLNAGWKGVSLRGEYARKGKDLPSQSVDRAVNGEAWYVEAGYNLGGFSAAATFRTLRHMGTMISLYGTGTGNTLNYLPALTRQYTYMLANLNPYQVNAEGEMGGQIDLNYSIRSKSNRLRYWNFHANFSTFYTLDKEQSLSGERERLWRDLNFDVERQWDKRWKSTLLFSHQEWSPSHGFEHRTYVSNIVVADVTCKINRKHAVRAELQYLFTDEYEGDWVAGLLEYSLAPKWSFFGSVMSNLEAREANNYEKVTYYSGGLSFTKNRTRVQLSYGRNRAGYVCSGGVCRFSPAYTGVNLMVTTSF